MLPHIAAGVGKRNFSQAAIPETAPPIGAGPDLDLLEDIPVFRLTLHARAGDLRQLKGFDAVKLVISESAAWLDGMVALAKESEGRVGDDQVYWGEPVIDHRLLASFAADEAMSVREARKRFGVPRAARCPCPMC